MKGHLTLVLLGPMISVGVLVTTPACAQDACSAVARPMTDIGRVVSAGIVVTPGQLLPVNYNEPGRAIRYFRALLVATTPLPATWHLTIRDQQLRVLETFSASQMRDGSTRWTRRLDARNTLYFDLNSSSPDTQIEIKRVIVMPESAENPYYSLQNPDSYAFAPLQDAPTGRRRLGDYVGFLMSSWGARSWCCSGVVVGEDLFLTNWHCGGDEERMPKDGFWSRDVCENTIIDMSWDGDSQDREFICTEVVDKSESNDFALLRIRPLRGEDSLRRPTIRRDPIHDGEPLVIVHHPACRAKQVSLGCNVRNESFRGWQGNTKSDFTYPCDTEGGSSGAPVFDQNNQLLGIHHLGFSLLNGTCDKLNKGVHIQSIIDALKAPAAAKLREIVK